MVPTSHFHAFGKYGSVTLPTTSKLLKLPTVNSFARSKYTFQSHLARVLPQCRAAGGRCDANKLQLLALARLNARLMQVVDAI